MTYKCLECGHIFDEGEEKHYVETHGLEAPPFEEWWGCPICAGNYEVTMPCIICGSAHLKEELADGICEKCIEDASKDFELCYKIAREAEEKEEISINRFYTALLSANEIESILLEYLRNKTNIECNKWIKSDFYWFTERLEKEVKKNECKKK